MADAVLTKQTTLPSEEVITRAVQFFSSSRWRPTGQSPRTATFEGRVPVPWFTLLLTILGFMFCLLPGIIMYVVAVRKLRRFQNLVISTAPAGAGTEVTARFPSPAKSMVKKFLAALPDAPSGPPPVP